MKQPAVYIMASKKNGTIYTGVTSNLMSRVYQHKANISPGFAAKYNCKLLVFYEMHYSMEAAIRREKQIKTYLRRRKLQLIEHMNPQWKDLYEDVIEI